MGVPAPAPLVPEAVVDDRQRGRAVDALRNQQPVHQKAANGPLFLYRYAASALDPEPVFLR